MATDRLYAETHLLDPTQSLEDAATTAELLENFCAQLCPDGTFASAKRYEAILFAASRN